VRCGTETGARPMTLRRDTRRQANGGNRNGLFLGAILLIRSAQLFATEITVPTAQPNLHEQIAPKHVLVLSIPDRKLAVTEGGHVLKVYDVAVGKSSTPSPTGELQIINKLVDPTYHHQGKVVPPGKSNPLGNRWMGLSAKGYGIHGTNLQSSVGKAASHGCFRMRRHDVEELFTLVRVGDVVEIHAERDHQVAGIFASPAVVAQSAPAPTAPQTSLAVMAVIAQEIGD
jgi:hypothetical protein